MEGETEWREWREREGTERRRSKEGGWEERGEEGRERGETQIERQRGEREEEVEIERERDTEDNAERRLLPISPANTYLRPKFLLRDFVFVFNPSRVEFMSHIFFQRN